jgi:hypothetical protein
VVACPSLEHVEGVTPLQDEFVAVDTSTRVGFHSRTSVATYVSTMRIMSLANKSRSMSTLTIDFNGNKMYSDTSILLGNKKTITYFLRMQC